MNLRLLAALTLSSFMFAGLANAAPRTFKGYCMVVQTGNPPGAEVKIKRGTKLEFAKVGDLSFQIAYGKMLDEKNVLQLKVFDTVANKQSVVDVFIENEFPRRIDLVSALGSMSCQRD